MLIQANRKNRLKAGFFGSLHVRISCPCSTSEFYTLGSSSIAYNLLFRTFEKLKQR